MLLIALASGTLIGLILGLTGAGGGIFAVPALTLALGWTMTQASPIALLAVGSAAAIGAADGHKKGLVRYRAATLIASVGIISAPFGQYMARLLPERWLTLLFAAVMLIIAVRLWRSPVAHTLGDDGADVRHTRSQKIPVKTGRIVWNLTSFVALSLIGILSGFTTGLLGVGGGFIIVPALLCCSEITLAGIVATSLMAIALISGGAVISAWITGNIDLSWSAILFISGTMIGILPGRYWADTIPKHHLLRIFSSMIVVVCILLLYRKFS